jgi:hypothetical protein
MDASGRVESPKQAEYRRWWQPVLDMRFDDPDQESPKLYWPNHVRTPLPWPQTWITAYRYKDQIGVATGGRVEALNSLNERLQSQVTEILTDLPTGTEYKASDLHDYQTMAVTRALAELGGEEGARTWAIKTLNAFSNALRPRVEAAYRGR